MTLEKVHLQTVEKKKERLEEIDLRKERADSGSGAAVKRMPLSDMLETEHDIDTNDTDFTAPVVKKVKKPEFISLQVPRNISQSVALNSKRWKISDVATASNLSLLIQESGGDLDDFVVSTSTCRRQGIKAVTEDTENIKEKFKINLSERDLTLHIDGKAVKEFSAGCHLEQERIAVIVSSPSLKSPQVLGVPPAESSKGVDQLAVVMELIKEWGIEEYIMAISFDTTTSNTGVNFGDITLVEKEIAMACLWSACQRHIH